MRPLVVKKCFGTPKIRYSTIGNTDIFPKCTIIYIILKIIAKMTVYMTVFH